MNFFQELRQASVTRQKEFFGDNITELTLEFHGNELAGEVGEACNEIKKLARGRLGAAGAKTDHSDLQDELADVIICVEMIAQKLDIDIEQAVRAKFNKTSEKYNLKTTMKEDS